MPTRRTLARRTVVRHPSGLTLQTPLLVPSFSSKGFGSDSGANSEVHEIFRAASEVLTETMLVSAYDIYYEHLPQLDAAITELTFVDSGGYEIDPYHDLSTVFRQGVSASDWDREKLGDVLHGWPQHVPAVFISFDHPESRMPLDDQIESSKSFFVEFPGHLHEILIKPEKKSHQYVQVKNVVASASLFGGFDVIGVTEKELGGHLLERMKVIAEMRLAFDDAGVNSPIHVFGSLDPVTSVLYFLAGAEIFDGLTWLRFGYIDGQAVYIQNFGALKVGIGRRQDRIKANAIAENCLYLTNLQNQMSTFTVDQNFSRFKHHSKFLKESYDLLRTKVGRLS